MKMKITRVVVNGLLPGAASLTTFAVSGSVAATLSTVCFTLAAEAAGLLWLAP